MENKLIYLTKHIAFILYENGIISKDEEDVYIYGAEVVLMSLATLISCILLGYIFGRLFEIAIFLVSYRLLRNYSGGYHAKTRFRCYLCSISICIIVLTLLNFLPIDLKTHLCWMLMITMDCLLILFAPSQSIINPKTKDELKICKKKLLRILFLNNVLVIACINFEFIDFCFTLVCALMAAAILSFINYILILKKGVDYL